MDEYVTKATLTANVGAWVAGFKLATNEYNKFNTTVSNTSMSSTDAVGKSSSIISSAMKLSAVAVVGLGVASLKTGADFEHQMSRVGAIADATGPQLKAMNDQAIKLGADTAFSAKEAAAGMENLASAGMKPKQIMEAMPGVLNLAAVSGGNVAESAENAATALNGFGLEADKSGHVADVFARAAADTNAEASDMGEALKMVAPQAHAAGISLEETAATIGTLSDAGIKGSMAGSNLGMALTKVQNPSVEASNAMKDLGFNAYDSAGKMKPLATQVSELKSKMAGMKDEQKAYFTSQIYGVQGGRAMNVLLQAQSGKLEGLTKSLEHSDGAAAKMAKTMQNDLKSSVEQFFGSLESLAIVVEQTFGGTLKGAVDGVTDSIGNFAKYLQDNQGQIQKTTDNVIKAASGFMKFLPSIDQVGGALEKVLPALVTIAAFKGIGAGGARTIKMLTTMQADLTLVSTGAGMVAKSFGAMNAFTLGTFKTLGSTIIYTTKKVNNFNNALTAQNAGPAMIKSMGNSFTSLSGKAKGAGTAMVNAIKNPTVAVKGMQHAFESSAGGINGAMFKILKGVNASDQSIAMLTNTAMKGGSAVGAVGQAGAGASEGLLSGSTAAGGFGMSLGALIPIALIVAAVGTAIYAAWSTNFGNIRGVVESAVNSIKNVLTGMKPSIDAIKTALEPIGKLVGGIFAIVGVGVIVAIAGEAIGLATELRIVVDVLAALAQIAQAGFYALKGLFEKMIPGGKDGAESMDKASEATKGATASIKDIGTAVKDGFNAGKDAISQFGKSADDSKGKIKAVSVSVKDVSGTVKQMKTDFDNSKTKFSDLINTDGVSDKTKGFLTDVTTTLDKYQTATQTASDKYQAAMKKADDKNGEDRLKAVNKASQDLAEATNKNGQDLINISTDLDRQLKEKKFSDGTAMNADQVKLLTEQNNLVKQKLLEQNQIYVQAQMARVQNGQTLSKQEQLTTMQTVQANYTAETQQIQVGEQKLKELKDQMAKSKDATTKARLQQEIVSQQQHNDKLIVQQQGFGLQMNMSIANGGKLNFQTWSQGLQNMKNVTAPQLQSMYLSFVKMNTDTGEQMKAFALMLQRSGTKGVGGLVKALQDGKLSAKEAAESLKNGGEEGLKSLPPSMFAKGKDGQAKFIAALKSGDFKGAGKYLATESADGAEDKGKHGKSGKDNNKSYSDGLKEGKEKAKSAGQDIAESGADGAGKGKKKYSSAGKDNAKSYNSGIEDEKDSAKSAGTALANAAKDGAESVSFESVGSNMAEGVATGINASADSAVSAMTSLVSRVNAEAKKAAGIHSPSRLLRDEVGKYLSLGVAAGIDEYAPVAAQSMANLVSGINNDVESNRLNMDLAYQTANHSSVDVETSFGSNVVSAIQRTNALISQLLDKNQTLVLDTGTLVGETKDLYDNALGDNVQDKSRWER